MRRINQNKTNISYIFSIMLLLSSITLIIMAIAFGYTTFKTKTNCDTFTDATRIEINSYKSYNDGISTIMYSPVFIYKVNSKEYSCTINSSSSNKPRIDNNKVYYKSQNPDYCISEYEISENNVLIFIFTIISIPEFIIGLFIMYRKRLKIKNLEKNGELIKNIPCSISPSNVTFNNQPGYTITIEYNGQKLKSESKFNIDTTRKTADLLIDPFNPKIYFIDFDIEQKQYL